VVWRAYDQRLNRMVAIKMLPPALAIDPGLRARFEQEARALGALNHPNIVTIYDIGQDDEGRAYMRGLTLKAALVEAVSRATRSSVAVWNRASGDFARHLRTIDARAGDTFSESGFL